MGLMQNYAKPYKTRYTYIVARLFFQIHYKRHTCGWWSDLYSKYRESSLYAVLELRGEVSMCKDKQ